MSELRLAGLVFPMSTTKPARPRAPILDRIGRTPLLPLRFDTEGVTIYAKAEFLNPSGSIKDRFALGVIEDAERRGLLRADSTIVECTSGNTGIALAMVGAAKGHRVKILMSRSASIERRQLIEHFGGEVELFDPTRGYATGIALANEMAAADPRIFLPRQFENPINAADHSEHTAREILADIPGARVDAFVTGYGTGGTLAGCSHALRAACPGVKIFAMEPAESALLAGECPCCHLIDGVAGGYLPPLLAQAHVDAPVPVRSAEAIAMACRLAQDFGLLVGTSSGANVAAALTAARTLPRDAAVVTVLCDRAERYFSTALFQQR